MNRSIAILFVLLCAGCGTSVDTPFTGIFGGEVTRQAAVDPIRVEAAVQVVIAAADHSERNRWHQREWWWNEIISYHR